MRIRSRTGRCVERGGPVILVLDVGNSQVFGGVFDGEKLRFKFRKSSRQGNSSDELGIFLKSVLRENELKPEEIRQIAVCSVVPDLVYSIRSCCVKYFGITPFVLQAGVKTGLRIKYRNPIEVGSDRITNAIAATQLFPKKNLIIIDFGTATTYCAITADRDYLGGLIIPGLRISMEALEGNTAKLPAVEIQAPGELVGRSTVESIQSGLYHGNLAMVREITRQIKYDTFNRGETVVIGTGGFSRLFEKEGVFDALLPDLVLHGLRIALELNSDAN